MNRAIDRLMRWSCGLALVGLGFVAWSVLVPRALPLVLAMSIGQLLGTVALVLYVVSVVLDLSRAGLLGRGERHDER